MRKTDVSKLYEAYPHLGRIDELWGTRDCREFINRLMNDTREGQRRGFPGDHARTILRLLLEHDREFPQFEESITSDWRNSVAPSRRGIQG
ncbi:hypothetical protein [Aromatoleum petrolei]|uniref:Uncharacterized protein n=1 Tax=Aromatoleum petrolei TaxID=76116 RepID=A0ABX1MI16_9RHOO|nr:hypothetical protein [Aromatoleum petrolei]NMF87423.1 hypothetical protein [Aromatoleum petrolei]QTQ35789.1 Uncharacterized protein ToN1_16340 [Aromatoleum petrolei]